MDDTTTFIAALAFARPPNLNFAACVGELDSALRDAWHVSYNVKWDQDDLVTFSIDGSRVVLAYGEHPHPDIRGIEVAEARPDPFHSRPMAACLMVSIGPSPQVGQPTRIANNAEALLHVIVQRFNGMARADLIQWSQQTGPFRPGRFDAILRQSTKALIDEQRLLRQRLAGPKPAPKPHRFDQPDVERLMRRLEGHIPQPRPAVPATVDAADRFQATQEVARTGAPMPRRRAPQAIEIANTEPTLPGALTAEMEAIRAALYPPTGPMGFGLRPRSAKPRRRKAERVHLTLAAHYGPTLPQRMTVYTLNTTLMLVALPVGSAILVYNLARGEDLKLSTRMIAISSTLVGLAHLLHMSPFLPFA